MLRTVLMVTVCVSVFALSGCAGAVHAQGGPTNAIGKTCTVEFKRDLLGIAAASTATAPVVLDKAASTSVTGTLLAMDIGGQYVVRQADGSEVWIPAGSVLCIVVRPAEAANQ